MKIFGALALAMLLPAAAGASTVYDYDFRFNGSSVVLAAGSDDPNGDVFLPGDGFRMTIAADADRGWTVGSDHVSSIDMSFRVAGCGTRSGMFDLTLRRDGVDVYSVSRGPFNQSCIHMGGQQIAYAAGTIFDEIVLEYTLLSSTTPTSILNGNPGFWGAVWRSNRVSFGEVPDVPTPVPAPPAAALMLGALGMFAVRRRRRA